MWTCSGNGRGSPDGDTLWLLDAEVVEDVRGIGAKVLANPDVNKKRTHPLGDINRLTIRFQGLDTPEIHANGSRQNYGFLAFAKLEEIGGMRFHAKRGDKSVEVRCSVTRQSDKETILDPNQRVLGYVTLGELNANTEMVRLGYAFPFLYESISPAMQQRLRQYAEAASTALGGSMARVHGRTRRSDACFKRTDRRLRTSKFSDVLAAPCRVPQVRRTAGPQVR